VKPERDQPKRDPETGFVQEPDEDPVEAFRMPLMQHLIELRRRLIISIAVSFVCMCVTYFYAEKIWTFLAEPMNEALVKHNGHLIQLDPLEGFTNQLRVAGLAGFLLASPVVMYQIWKFIAPGLYPKEQRLIVPLAMASTFLFALGITFGYFGVFKYAFPFFLDITYQGVEAQIPINTYLAMATNMLLAFGLCFQLPIVVFFAARIGLVNHRDMIAGFRYAMVGILIIAAMMTPGPDILSQLIMALPLTLLYIAGIGVARIFSTKPLKPPEEVAKTSS
jgi:sec-independent protein translocase protein TatC